jgi:hypothetical protein
MGIALERQRHRNAKGLQATASTLRPIGKSAGAHLAEVMGRATPLAEGRRYAGAS